MSSSGTNWPGQPSDTRPANKQHAGQMPRHHAGDATHATFATVAVGSHTDIYVPPATASVAGALSAADKAKLDGWPVSRLTQAVATDILNATATTAGTYYDASTVQNFTVNSATSFLLIFVRFAALHTPTAGANGQLEVVAFLDGTTRHPLSAHGIAGAGGFLTGGGGSFAIQGLAAGTHTIKIQVSPNLTGTTYLRAATFPRTEFCLVTIVELSP